MKIVISLKITKSVAINVIVYSIPLKSKYHIPLLKHDIDITSIITVLIITENILLLLAYQQIYASNGEIRVNLYHIII